VVPCIPFCTEGTILSVDPSIGSASSMPGYALCVDGCIVDCGELKINCKDPSNKRLGDIQSQLRMICPSPNVVICEAIRPTLSCGGTNVVQLHWAVGVILATYPTAHTVMVPNQTWKACLRRTGLDNYVKSDEHDAIVLMWTVFHICQAKFKNENDIRRELLTPVTGRK
jgi:hypothetical protein